MDMKKFRSYRLYGRYSVVAPPEYHEEIDKKDEEYYEQMEEDITCRKDDK